VVVTQNSLRSRIQVGSVPIIQEQGGTGGDIKPTCQCATGAEVLDVFPCGMIYRLFDGNRFGKTFSFFSATLFDIYQ
jgi:hypothetical protein